jgi:ankyrin repeat protein
MITALLIATLTLTNVSTESTADLVSAAKHNDVSAVVTALQNGADVNAANDLGITPLMIASRHTDLTLFDVLVESGADVNQRNNAGATAIFIAVRNGNIQAVARLISAGADLTVKNNQGRTAHDIALMYDKPVIASLIQRHHQAQMARK